VIYRQK